MKRFVALLIVTMLAFSPLTVFADDLKIIDTNGTEEPLTQEEVIKIFEENGYKILTSEEVENNQLKSSNEDEELYFMCRADVESYIAKLELESKQVTIEIENQFSISSLDLVPDTRTISMSLRGGPVTGTRRSSKMLYYETNVTEGLVVKKSVTVGYQYDFEDYPGEPARYFNYKITDIYSSDVTPTVESKAAKFHGYTDSCTIESDTKVSQWTSIDYEKFMWIPLPLGNGFWTSRGTFNVTGTGYHHLPH